MTHPSQELSYSQKKVGATWADGELSVFRGMRAEAGRALAQGELPLTASLVF